MKEQEDGLQLTAPKSDKLVRLYEVCQCRWYGGSLTLRDNCVFLLIGTHLFSLSLSLYRHSRSPPPRAGGINMRTVQ